MGFLQLACTYEKTCLSVWPGLYICCSLGIQGVGHVYFQPSLGVDQQTFKPKRWAGPCSFFKQPFFKSSGSPPLLFQHPLTFLLRIFRVLIWQAEKTAYQGFQSTPKNFESHFLVLFKLRFFCSFERWLSRWAVGFGGSGQQGRHEPRFRLFY